MAHTHKRMKFAQLHLVKEATQDTFVAPAGDGSNMFLVEEVSVSYDQEFYESQALRGGSLNPDGTPGSVPATLTFRVSSKGSGTAGTAPDYRTMFLACGFRESVVASTSVTYYPFHTFDGATAVGPPVTENPNISYSSSFMLDGMRFGVKGAYGNLAFEGAVSGGGPGFWTCTMQGAFVTVAADALETPTYQTTTAPAFRSAAFAVNFGGAYTPKGITRFTLDIGNQIRIGRDINEDSGIYGARIMGKNPTGEFDPELVAVATHDFFGIANAGTAGTLTTGAIGSAAGNIYTINVARCQYRMPSLSNDEGVAKLAVPFRVSSANDDVEGTDLDVSVVYT